MYVRYERGLRALQLSHAMSSLMQFDPELVVTVYWGSTGTGKTRRVAELGDVYPLRITESGTLWFDGYQGQRRLLIDEFYGNLKPSILLELLDKYRRQWPVKGGHVVGTWKEIYLTCNVHPSEWYGSTVPTAVKAAIMRRLDHVVHVEAPPVQPTAFYDGLTQLHGPPQVRDTPSPAVPDSPPLRPGPLVRTRRVVWDNAHHLSTGEWRYTDAQPPTPPAGGSGHGSLPSDSEEEEPPRALRRLRRGAK